MVRMDSASLGSKEQTVITGADVREESPLFADRAHKLPVAVEDKYFAILTENEHKAGQFRDNALLDVLLYVDSFLKLKSTLRHLPHLDA